MAKPEKQAAESGLPSNVVSVASMEAAAAPSKDAKSGAMASLSADAALKIGIENTVNFVKFGAALAVAIKAAKADGKIDVADIALLFPVVPMVGPMITGAGQVPKELGDLDDDELNQLIAAVGTVEGIGNRADILLKVKASIKFAHAGYELYTAFAKKA
jgi:hypothetical protein